MAAAQPRPDLPQGQLRCSIVAIERLEGYLHMADWGTCAIDWPLMDEWDKELEAGMMPGDR